jgi:hypothetical protein
VLPLPVAMATPPVVNFTERVCMSVGVYMGRWIAVVCCHTLIVKSKRGGGREAGGECVEETGSVTSIH